MTTLLGRGAIGLALVVALAVEAWDPTTPAADVCYLAVLVGAAASAGAGVRRWPRSHRRLPVLIAAGLAANAVGEVVWTALARTGGEADVSVADVAWLTSYVLLCAAAWEVLRSGRRDGEVGWDLVVDAATVVTVSVLLFWSFSVADLVDDPTVSAGVRAVWATYPVLDAVLLALTARVLVQGRGGRSPLGSWFAVGVGLWLAADLLQLAAADQPAAVRVVNGAWMLGPVLMAAAVRRSTAAPVAAAPATERGWVGQVALATTPLAVPPALELVADLRGQPDHPFQLLVGTTAVVGLALVRTGRLVWSEHRAHHELREAHRTAMAALEAKEMFLATISHEIRTPLTTLIGTTELLHHSTLEPRQQRLVDLQRRSGAHLLHLVDSILDFSRTRSGQVVLHTDVVDLRQLVDDVVESHQHRAQARGNTCAGHVDPRVPPLVRADATRLTQVLNNLLVNALKFTEHGRVDLRVGPEDGGVLAFAVEDSGIGIPETDLERVFESFSQVDASATRRYGGTGLGLAICRELTELMGGTISVTSQLGRGSTFTARLPLPAVASHDAAPASRPHPVVVDLGTTRAAPSVASRTSTTT